VNAVYSPEKRNQILGYVRLTMLETKPARLSQEVELKELPNFASEPLEMKGVSNEAVIQVAKEMLLSAGIAEKSLSVPIDSREEALCVLSTITQVARNNPVVSVLEAMGEVPDAEELVALASA
jgi:hypothetical protein